MWPWIYQDKAKQWTERSHVLPQISQLKKYRGRNGAIYDLGYTYITKTNKGGNGVTNNLGYVTDKEKQRSEWSHVWPEIRHS
jgi:hypothetical protein